ncbi:MAG TPA: DUF4249 family protein [Marinilabiliaceae bacterium]|nr:DUF4249 family protein [Marinilabiliaceae bacterium]
MKRVGYIIYMFVFAALMGCESDLNLKLEESGGNLVLFSFIQPDSIFKVHVSKSVSHSSMNDYDRIYDGYVRIKKNGVPLDSFPWPFKELWTSRPLITIKAGDQIDISVTDGDNNRATGSTTVLHPVKILDVSMKSAEESTNSENRSCTITFSDPPEVDNFYQLTIIEEVWIKDETLPRSSKNVRYLKDDQVFYIRDQEGSLLGGIDFSGTFSDYLITKNPYKLQIRIPRIYFREPAQNEKRKLVFQLLSLTKDYYDYSRSRIVAEYNQKLPVVNPVKIHNNIKGGLGLVGGISADTLSISFIGEDYN